MPGQVTVVGSLNADFITHVQRRPGAGETIIATQTQQSAGGKGGNQATAAARAGARVSFIGAVGDDALGAEQIRALAVEGVDAGFVRTTSAPTGTAFITVTPDGENAIVVSLGANGNLDPVTVIDALGRGPRPAVVLTQTETPPSTVEAVARWCADNAIRFILNNGPYRAFSRETSTAADPLVLNEHEARELCGEQSLSSTALAEAVQRASAARSVVVTLGAAGVALREQGQSALFRGTPVEQVVDTAGAGDTFVGTLSALLAGGLHLADAVQGAVDAAGKSVTWAGARPLVEV